MAMTKSESGKLGYIASADKHKLRYARIKELYENNPKTCHYCGKSLSYEIRTNKYCNHSCCASHNNLGVCRNRKTLGQSLPQQKEPKIPCVYVCKWCNKVLPRKLSFCNLKCYSLYKIQMMIKTESVTHNHKRAMKSYLIETRGHQCEDCKFTKWKEQLIPLELHHIDGNVENMELINLKLLCPNCHTLTDNYKSKNRNTNSNRKIYGKH